MPRSYGHERWRTTAGRSCRQKPRRRPTRSRALGRRCHGSSPPPFISTEHILIPPIAFANKTFVHSSCFLDHTCLSHPFACYLLRIIHFRILLGDMDRYPSYIAISNMYVSCTTEARLYSYHLSFSSAPCTMVVCIQFISLTYFVGACDLRLRHGGPPGYSMLFARLGHTLHPIIRK